MNGNNSMSLTNLQNLINSTSKENTFTNLSPYSKKAKRLKLDVKGLEVLMPLYPEFNAFGASFIATVKTEVVVEFNDFVRLVNRHESNSNSPKPFNRELMIKGHLPSSAYPYLYSEFNLEKIAGLLIDLFESIDTDILVATKSINRTPNSIEVFEYYSTQTKRKLDNLISNYQNELNHIYLSYLTNITLLNIKSMILTGAEIINSKKSRINVAMMPVKFIPKVGTHLSTLPLRYSKTYIDYYKIVSAVDIDSKAINGLRLDTNNIKDLLNLTVRDSNIDLFEVSEYYGLSRELFDSAILQVLNLAVNIDVNNSTYDNSQVQNFEAVNTVTDSIDSATEFINDFEEFIDSMAVLVNEFRSLFKYGGLKVVDIE